MKESHIRSLVKGISWRATGTLDTIVIAFIITGQITMALSIGAVEVFTKIILFYLHERLWGKITWGKNPDQKTTAPNSINDNPTNNL
ncbi:MAG: DUF2061 domain-containing protein [Sphingobacteriales bacterium]|nr:MAG: DUF2061 domain-containing protein [Sphingobacteriales bacterium]